MKHKLALRIGTFVLIAITVITLWGSKGTTVKAEDGHENIPWVDPALLAKSKTDEPLDFLIYFEEQADLSAAYSMTWEARGWFVYETLTAVAAESQAEVRQYLDAQGAPYEAYWVQNVIAVQSSTAETLTGLLNYGEIESLQSIPQIYLEESSFVALEEADPPEIYTTSSNLVQIKADQVWSMGFSGVGIVVGSIDTGARYTHEALIGSYRGNLGDGNFSHHYHWWDAINGQAEPYDDHGHGSHVAGIMAGARAAGEEIGVAPGADWIACKAIGQNGRAWGNDLIKCGQFMAAPTNLNGNNPNPNVRPQVVNNSWGDCGRTYNPWYEGVIEAWLAAGIYPVFASGNATNCGYPSPPGLNTVGNPARSPHVTAVGSTGRDDGQYASHSNWGPTDSPDTINPEGYPAIKPQVVAPGVGIRSALGSGDDAYAALSGTSMSAPHVAGLVALVWGSADCLTGDYAHTETLIQETASPIPYDTGNGDEGPDFVPNHATGWGEINALAAVDRAVAYCSSGLITGQVVSSEDQQPVGGALIEAAAQGDAAVVASAVADEAGYFQLSINSDTIYDLSAAAYGYHQELKSGVEAPDAGGRVTADFALTPKTNFVNLSGVVTDGGGQGYPLYARITIQTDGHSEDVFTNPFDGSYALTVYDDLVYSLSVQAMFAGYQPMIDPDVSFEMPAETRFYALDVADSCDAPGYGLVNALTQTFDHQALPEGWAVADHSGTGVTWGFENASGRGNLSGGTGGFAMVDADYAGPFDVDTALVSPLMDLSGEPIVILTFDQDFFYYAGNQEEVADVDISIDGGEWQTVLSQTASVRGPHRQAIDISELAAHQVDVRVRFRYYNANADWWWQVDNVRVGGQVCAPIPGGVLAGFVTEKKTGDPIDGVRVSGEHGSVFTSSGADDAYLGAGFYWLFLPLSGDPEQVTVSAEKDLYIRSFTTIDLYQGQVIRFDMPLESYLSYLGTVFGNLLSLIWEFLVSLFGLVQNWV